MAEVRLFISLVLHKGFVAPLLWTRRRPGAVLKSRRIAIGWAAETSLQLARRATLPRVAAARKSWGTLPSKFSLAGI
jgi:hypothetical protein